MCGISGIFDTQNKFNSKDNIDKMIKILIHRGPDSNGKFIDSTIALGHNRLAILDLSEAGKQPMFSDDNNKIITFNGEIYNYIEIRQELKKLGYSFQTQTDTEVILAAYQKWGESCLRKFNGMWAFALWDRKEKKLFCSRDRFGVKPFYYYFDGKIFAFASEIKALLTLPFIHTNPSDALIYDFLTSGMIDHTNETFFQHIYKLPAASNLFIQQGSSPIIKKYWDFDVSDQIIELDNRSRYNYAQIFRNAFFDAVRLRLRSDVPVGTCLSGGIDSSAIVCTLNELLQNKKAENIQQKQKTFSAVFREREFDEREYIEALLFKTKLSKHYIYPAVQNFMQDIEKLIWHQEEPFLWLNVYTQWSVMKLVAKNNVTVLLNGQGADEFLCGYKKFYLFYLHKLFKQKKYALFFKEALYAGILNHLFFNKILIKQGLIYIPAFQKMLNNNSILRLEFRNKYKDRKLNFYTHDNIGERIKEDLTKWSLPSLLRYEDKNSMAFSIETRLPFLDVNLIEKTAQFPLNARLENGWTKKVLRDSMKDMLPKKIYKRKSKLGFSIPGDVWFNETLNQEVEQTFQNANFLTNYVDTNALILNFKKSQNKLHMSNNKLFFRFYILELWAQKFKL